MSEQIILLKIGPRVTEWVLGNHGEGVRSLRPKEVTTPIAVKESRVIGHGVDGKVLRRYSAQDVKENNLPQLNGR